MDFLMSDTLNKAAKTFQTPGHILPHVRETFNQHTSSKVCSWMINVRESNLSLGKLHSCNSSHMTNAMESNQLWLELHLQLQEALNSLRVLMRSSQVRKCPSHLLVFSQNLTLGHSIIGKNTLPEVSPISRWILSYLFKILWSYWLAGQKKVFVPP